MHRNHIQDDQPLDQCQPFFAFHFNLLAGSWPRSALASRPTQARDVLIPRLNGVDIAHFVLPRHPP